jgi:Domain of unknown function (DUF4105)
VRGPLALLAAITCLVTVPAPAQTAAPAGAEPGAQLTVYLMTMGPGRLVWERFGHNAIWIHDPAEQPDQAYNYGLFDFHQQNFLLRFIKGQMWYWMDGFPAEAYVRTYRRDNRSVYLQELNLPPAARLELQRFLRWNQEPAHRFYHYDYYRDNCSTRVRDALDRVLGGAIKRQTDSVPAGTTYRFHTQRLTANDPLIFTGLLLALGQGVDRPISEWEEMFLPMEMRQHLRGVTIPGPDGRSIPLVASERTLFESTATPPPPIPPRWLARYLFLGVFLGSAAAWLGGVARRDRPARLAFGIVAGGWELLAGVAGVVLTGLWAFTDHVMAYRNENLFQVNPLALFLAVLVPFALRGSARAGRFAGGIAIAVAGLSVLGLALKVLPGFDQANVQVIALALPIHLGVAAGLGRSRQRPDRLTG